jgi:hypothetical protein
MAGLVADATSLWLTDRTAGAGGLVDVCNTGENGGLSRRESYTQNGRRRTAVSGREQSKRPIRTGEGVEPRVSRKPRRHVANSPGHWRRRAPAVPVLAHPSWGFSDSSRQRFSCRAEEKRRAPETVTSRPQRYTSRLSAGGALWPRTWCTFAAKTCGASWTRLTDAFQSRTDTPLHGLMGQAFFGLALATLRSAGRPTRITRERPSTELADGPPGDAGCPSFHRPRRWRSGGRPRAQEWG